jgi:hypothetical protein
MKLLTMKFSRTRRFTGIQGVVTQKKELFILVETVNDQGHGSEGLTHHDVIFGNKNCVQRMATGARMVKLLCVSS